MLNVSNITEKAVHVKCQCNTLEELTYTSFIFLGIILGDILYIKEYIRKMFH